MNILACNAHHQKRKQPCNQQNGGNSIQGLSAPQPQVVCANERCSHSHHARNQGDNQERVCHSVTCCQNNQKPLESSSPLVNASILDPSLKVVEIRTGNQLARLQNVVVQNANTPPPNRIRISRNMYIHRRHKCIHRQILKCNLTCNSLQNKQTSHTTRFSALPIHSLATLQSIPSEPRNMCNCCGSCWYESPCTQCPSPKE
jgi:hypothetical protein